MLAQKDEMRRDQYVRDLASALKEVVRASRDRFAPVEGVRIVRFPGRQSWYEAKTYLPGANYCRIDDEPALMYSCIWGRAEARMDMTAFHTRLAADIETALGPDFKRRQTAKNAGSVFFDEQASSGGATVQVLPPAREPEPTVKVIVLPAKSNASR